MASAVPYDPDDFDNNPFAENTIVTPASYQQEEPNGNDNTLDNNDGNDNDNDNDNDNRPLLNSSSSKNTKTSDSITSTTTTTATDSEFTEFPTELDLKKYLPERLHKDKFQLIIKIQEIEGNGANTSKNPIFKFNAKVTKTSAFRKEIYKNVRRTYKEIESLYKYLIYNNIEVFIPALPTVSSLYTPMSPEFITSVTNSFQNWFNRICCNPLLIKNKEFALFFEQNDFGYVPSKTKPSNNSVIATGLKRKTLKQFHPPYDSCEYLAQYRPMIKEVHLSCQKLLEKLDKCLKYQRQSAYYNNEFIILLGNLTNLESSPEMSKLWKKFNKFSSMLNETDLIKNVSLISELISFFRQIGDDTYNIKESLTNRHLLMRELINAEEATKKKHSIISKLKTKTTIDPLKVDEAIRSLELSNNLEKELRYQVKRTTYEMLIESKEYISYMVLSYKKLFKILAKHQIIQERKKLNLLINNRLINQHDSLSRLGRENLPEHIPINKSNSNARDSWNSRPKKSYADPMSRNSSQIKNNDISEEISNVDAKSAASLLASINF